MKNLTYLVNSMKQYSTTRNTKFKLHNCYIRAFRKYSNQATNSNERDKIKEISKNLHYRILLNEKYHGIVSWKKCTGSYVNFGQKICDIFKDDNSIETILAPTNGIIANRFIDEGASITTTTLLCLIKECEPETEIIRDYRLYKEQAENETAAFHLEDLDENILEYDSLPFVGRIQAKDFVPLKDDVQQHLENIMDKNLLEQLDEKKRRVYENLPAILEQIRKEKYESIIPQYLRDELIKMPIGENLHFGPARLKSSTEEKLITHTDLYEIINENFNTFIDRDLEVVHEGIRDNFLVAYCDIDMTNALQFAINEGENNNIKFEIKCIFFLAAVHALQELPKLIMHKNDQHKEINIAMGMIGGGKLAFPIIKHSENMTYIQIKEKLLFIDKQLMEGKDINNIKSDEESLAITNDWDYGSIRGPSCLYVSNYATISLNNIFIKTLISQNQRISQPMMSTALTFNNKEIHGQEALLFLMKLKKKIESLQHV